jgi:hypothetical protein
MGEDGQSISEQLLAHINEIRWGFGYDGSWRNPSLGEILDKFADDPDAIRDLTIFEMKVKSREMSGRAAEEVTLQTLLDLGLNEHYAKRMLRDCQNKMITSAKQPSDPVELLAREMEDNFSRLFHSLSKYGPAIRDGRQKVMDTHARMEQLQAQLAPVAGYIRSQMLLPKDWAMKEDEGGRSYFVHLPSGTTSWDLPKEYAAAAKFQAFVARKRVAATMGTLFATNKLKKIMKKKRESVAAAKAEAIADGQVKPEPDLSVEPA